MKISAALLLLTYAVTAQAQQSVDIGQRENTDELLSTSSDVLLYFNQLTQEQIRENVDALTRIDEAYSQALEDLGSQHSGQLQELLARQSAELAELSGLPLSAEERARQQREIMEQHQVRWAEALEWHSAQAVTLRDAYEADRLEQRTLNDEFIARLQEEQRRRLQMLVDGPIPIAAIRNSIGGPADDAAPESPTAGGADGDDQSGPMVPVRPEEPRPMVDDVRPEGPIFVAQTIATAQLIVVDSGVLSARGQENASASEFEPITIATNAFIVVDSGELSERGQEIADLPEFAPLVIDTPGMEVIDATE